MKTFTFLRSLHWPYRVILATLAAFAAVLVYAMWDSQRGLDTPVMHRVEPATPRGATDLIVFAHGYAYGSRPLEGLIRAVQQARPDADVLKFEYASQTFSNADPFRIAAEMEERIHQIVGERHYERIHLVGYSMGALLLRKAYVYGSGSVEDLPFAGAEATTRAPQDWVKRVERFVLLAGMNRGWSQEEPPKEITAWRSAVNALGLFIGTVSGTGTLIRQLERGEPFVANLRLQWLKVMSKAGDAGSGMRQPVVVQLLGDKDDVVSSADNRDVKVAKNFIWVGLSNTTHANVMDVDQPGAGSERRRRILQALGTEQEISELRRATLTPEQDEDLKVSTVVFVLHGIRDMGDWTTKFKEPLEKRFLAKHRESGEKVYVHSAGYGYFAMGPFLLGPSRQRNVRWFMDEVTELKAKFPNMKELHFIGHSNGTYLLASALQRYQTLKVDRVVFAGSVVPRGYPWSSLSGRVGTVRNFVGADDAVVAIFPNLFEIPLFRPINPDLGSAGFNGFMDGKFKDFETKFLKGGHSAALDDANLEPIVEFIMEGKKLDPGPLLVGEHPTRLRYWSQLCWAVWLGLAASLVAVGGGVFWLSRLAQRLFVRTRAMAPNTLAWLATAAYAYGVLMTLNTI